MKRVCLITGPPRCGKTTLIRQIAGEYSGGVCPERSRRACGFYTEEVREDGERTGFRLVTLDGRDAMLSHVGVVSPYRVGKYGVDIEALERVGVTALLRPPTACDLVVVDEIGKMEMLSLQFREAVIQLIDGGRRMLGTVMLHHHTWSDVLKARPEVKLIMLNCENYPHVLDEVRLWLKETA